MAITVNDTDTFYPSSRQQWRHWLQEHHDKKQSIWIICYKKQSGIASVSWSEAVDEALCYGWIDSTRKTVDHEKFIQFFSRRKPNGTWSKVNKAKIEQLIENGMMSKAGQACIDAAKQNGSWTILDDVEELIIPSDLEVAFEKLPGSKDYFLSLSKSIKKIILHRLVTAKKPETRQKRVNETATLAANKQHHKFG